MKKRKFIGILTAICLAQSLIFMACSNERSESTEAVSVVEETENTHTVTLYDSDGTTVLDTVSVEHGKTVELQDPIKDGYIFMGWYLTPDMSREYDLIEAVKDDIDLYAGFASYSVDDRSFYIVGSGESEVLSESNWGAVLGESQAMHKNDSNESNEYVITVDLKEGDQFQFAIDGTWADQRGYGYLDTNSIDGEKYLKSAAGLGNAVPKKTNIEVVVPGTYTFILTTYPAEDQYDTEDEYYTEETKENFNINPYDKITWTFETSEE